MKLLFDQNLSFKLCDRLADLFPGSTQARLVGLDMASDRDLWTYAGQHGFGLVSKDADFVDLAAFYGPPPKLIWLRGKNQSTAIIEASLRRSHSTIAAFWQDPDLACLEIF